MAAQCSSSSGSAPVDERAGTLALDTGGLIEGQTFRAGAEHTDIPDCSKCVCVLTSPLLSSRLVTS